MQREKLPKSTGIPTTKSGRRAKAGRSLGIMLMCGKVTQKNLIGRQPIELLLFSIYSLMEFYHSPFLRYEYTYHSIDRNKAYY